MKSLFKNSCYNIIYVMLNILFPLITSMYVSRILLVDGVGKVSYVQTITSYFTVIAGGGLSVYGIRAIAKSGNSKGECSRVFSELCCVNLAVSLTAFAGYLGMVMCIPKFRADMSLFLAYGLQIGLNVFNIDWFYKGKEEYSYIVSRSLCVKSLALLSVFLFVKSREDYVMYAMISSLALVGNHLLNILHSRRYVSFQWRGLHVKDHLSPLLTLTLMGLLGTVYSTIDVTMLEAMLGDRAVGLYTNAHKSINVILSGTTAITAVFLPRLSMLYQKSKQEFDNAVKSGVEVLSVICIPAATGVFFLAVGIVTMLYGNAFREAAGALRLFAPLLIINSFGDLFAYQVLIAIGQEKKRLAVNIAGVVLNIGLNSVLIPYFAQNGAALASVISELLLNMVITVYVIREIRFRFPVVTVVKSCLASFIMALWLYWLLRLDLNPQATCFMGTASGVVVYFIASFALKNEVVLLMVSRVLHMIRGRLWRK